MEYRCWSCLEFCLKIFKVLCCYLFSEFSVGNMEGVHVGVHGLGPFNWLAKKVVLGVVHQNIQQVVVVLLDAIAVAVGGNVVVVFGACQVL